MVLCFLCAKAVVQMMYDEDEKAGLGTWFPNPFRISDERMSLKFQGKLTLKPQELEVQAQS
jgi:hypothetical protein